MSIAKITVSAEFDLQRIAKTAGSAGGMCVFYEDGRLCVADVSQTALDAAFAAYDPAAQKKEVAWSAIKAERDRRTEQGGYKVGTKWFHSDQKSRSQQLGLVLLGASIPENLQWKTMDGSFVTMTQTLAQQILAAGAASDQAIFAAAETHKAAMQASADPAAYDFSAGWPTVYGSV